MPPSETISFKGTRQGILMSISENEAFGKVMDELKKKLQDDSGFFAGSFVSLDLGWREMDGQDLDELLNLLAENNLKLLGIISTSITTRQLAEARGLKVIIGRLGLADHHGRKKSKEKAITPEQEPRFSFTDPAFLESPTGSLGKLAAESSSARIYRESGASYQDTLYIKKTIRSGQTIEHPGNLVIVGDVNPGAELRAGGDIIVIGALRGVAHAGRRQGNEPAFITALKFQPTQIRIGDKIENNFNKSITQHNLPITAKLSNGKIEYRAHI